MKRMFSYLKDYTKECILSPLFKLLEAFFELMIPMVVASIIDIGIANGNQHYIIGQCLIMAALGSVGMISAITAQYFAAKASVGFAKKIRRTLFCHIQSLSYSDFDQVGSATLLTRMTSDVNQIQTGINLTLRLLLRSPLIVFGSMIMAFTIDVKAALIFAGVIPVLGLVVAFIMYICIPLYRKVQISLDRVMGLSRENLSGVRVLRAFGREDEESREFGKCTAGLAKAQLHVGRVSALMNPLTYIIINIAIIVLMWVGALRVEAGILTQGAIVALYNYMSQILVELIKLANLIINISKALACVSRIETVLNIEPSIQSPVLNKNIPDVEGFDYAVQFRQVSLCYNGSTVSAIREIDFAVRRGETVGIIGGTGSGKSSLINLIPRFYEVYAGSVLVNGVDVRKYPLDQLRSKIGIVPQQAVLFHGTIRENMQWGKKDASDEEIWQSLEAAQIADMVRKKAGGLDYLIEQRGQNLSGGQRQRLTIARALVRNPEILILDDSASALDYATDAALRRSIQSLEGNLTVFLISQRASSVRYADNIIVLDDGAVVGSGTNEQLLDSCSIYREIYETQFRIETRLKGGAYESGKKG